MGCNNDKSKPNEEAEVNLKRLVHFAALPKKVKSPKANPTTPKKVELGRLLFFDPILSGNKDVACATCHHPNNGYAEFLDLSIGVNGVGLSNKRKFSATNDMPFVKRNAHTILNTAFNGLTQYNQYDPETAPMFWDVRANSLEEQALEPLKALEEMRGHNFSEEEIIIEVVNRLKLIPSYQQLFTEAFGDVDAINSQNLAKAIAAFERTLITNNTRFDQFLRGKRDALSISEKEGFRLFKEVGCANCHNGPMLSDFKLHVLGVAENAKLVEPDSGFEAQYSFRTPSLRNLRFTAPYMHNGSLKTLQQVLEFYEDISVGKSRNALVSKDQFDPLVKELDLSVKEMAPIINFLNCLNDSNFDQEIPKEVPSGLPVGGAIQ